MALPFSFSGVQRVLGVVVFLDNTFDATIALPFLFYPKFCPKVAFFPIYELEDPIL